MMLEQSVIKYSLRLAQVTKPLRSCPGNRGKMILKYNLRIKCHSQNITRPSYSFSTVPAIANGDDCGCIARDLDTIIVLALLALNFILQRSHSSLALPRSRFRDSATATLMPGDMAQQQSKWSHRHNR